MSKHTIIGLGIAWMAMAGLSACGEVQRSADCFQVCDYYQTCEDSALDATGCTDACEERGEHDAAFEELTDRCEDCVEVRSCEEAARDCSAVCSEVIEASVN